MKKNRKYIIGIGIIAFLFIGYFILNSLLFTGIKPRQVNENGFQANYFVKNTTEKKASIVLIGGGQWGDYWAQEFAKKGFVGLSRPYAGREGLPKLPEEIDVEYFENAIEWLKNQPEVDPKKIAIMGRRLHQTLELIANL